jgi:hypothetical protein
MRNGRYIEFETLEKQYWSYLRNTKTAINYFLQTFRTESTHISHRKNLADMPNTGIFYSKDVALVFTELSVSAVILSPVKSMACMM